MLSNNKIILALAALVAVAMSAPMDSVKTVESSGPEDEPTYSEYGSYGMYGSYDAYGRSVEGAAAAAAASEGEGEDSAWKM
ncbi:hypothetical protein K490DRAFT_61297 [Saccharata proteae CBS 121410]|uniref:Uncharacterized protein n=1 Tax=Saccharata proteae CBS 121410 TaxID=1314787 RepID=A0A9P4I354_9PEZI|nr:hypothetical protein K490DRAFT_61297 [Saccharata proteae CBS 121410]